MEKRLIKNGEVNWDKIHTKNEITDMAFKKLEMIEDLMECYEIESLLELSDVLYEYKRILDIKKKGESYEQLKKD